MTELDEQRFLRHLIAEWRALRGHERSGGCRAAARNRLLWAIEWIRARREERGTMELSEAERREYDQLRAARSQITENESDGWGHCRYCNSSELPYAEDGSLMAGDDDLSQADDFRATHEEWCPSAILDKTWEAIVASHRSGAT